MIQFPCPKCERVLTVEDARAGSVELCPGCGEKLYVPPTGDKPARPRDDISPQVSADPPLSAMAPLAELAPPRMMRFKCPKCATLLGLDASRAGTIGLCSQCGQKFRVPDVRQESAEAASQGDQRERIESRGPPMPSLAEASPGDLEIPTPGLARPRKKKRRRRRESSTIFANLGVFQILLIALGAAWFLLLATSLLSPEIAVILLGLTGIGLYVTGRIWFLIVAFVTDPLWGFLCLCCTDIASIIFFCMYVDETWRPALLMLIGIGFVASAGGVGKLAGL